MKYLLLGIIKVYQMIPGPWHNCCRHIPTCSNYAIETIIRYGSLKGSFMAFKRVLRCNPFGTSGIDLVKEKK